MRFFGQLFRSALLLAPYALGQDLDSPDSSKQRLDYQSDVTRLRNIVINSLYSHRDVFLRELVSNANDALEKLRLLSLTDKNLWDGEEPLNVTIKAEKNEDGKGGRIVISDTGVGMSPEELTKNLGTLAKSGTTEFLQKAESSMDTTGTGNLIGAFGLGFYSSFLVADKVYVASRPPKTMENPDPVQHVFASSAEDSAFEVYPDPRGNTLNHGTEITLILKEDASNYLDVHTLQELVNKHSSFSLTFPIYLFNQYTEEVPDEEETLASEGPEKPAEDETSDEDDEAIIEDVEEKKEKEVKMKTVVVDDWMHLNPLPPVWLRDPKEVTDEEYLRFYQATFRDFAGPLAWQHFSGETDGVSFKAIVYIPKTLDDAYWQQPLHANSKDVRVMVKRVFITNDLDEPLPKWANWVKVIVDADDLPLNVSRETLQTTKFLKQIRQVIVRRIIQLFKRLEKEEPEKFDELQKVYGSVIKLGAVEDINNREKLAALARFHTNQRNATSLDDYVGSRKEGQKQIFYVADIGKNPDYLKQSVFVEKLDARGYEVLLLNEPLDEVLFQHLQRWKKLPFQDVAKAGLTFGDEDQDPEDEKEQQKETAERFKPLLDWLKEQATDVVRDVVISNRLVTSPVAIVADIYGYTANVEKLMNAASSKKASKDPMMEFAKKQKVLEINPKSPLIEGLLRRVENLPTDLDEIDVEAESELKEVASILIDSALVRSGFDVTDSNRFFTRVDRVLRRSLGVSETAQADASVKPAPPVDTKDIDEEEPAPPPVADFDQMPFQMPPDDDGKPKVILPDHLKDKVSIEMEEIADDDPILAKLDGHDEL